MIGEGSMEKPHSTPSAISALPRNALFARACRIEAVSVLALFAPSQVLAQSTRPADPYRHMYGGWNHMMGGWGYGMFGGIGMLLFWAVIIVVLVVLVRGFAGGGRPLRSGPDMKGGSRALDILKERYARGEVSKDEFEERRKTLAE